MALKLAAADPIEVPGRTSAVVRRAILTELNLAPIALAVLR